MKEIPLKEMRLSEDSSRCLWCAKKVVTPIEVTAIDKKQKWIGTVCSSACENEVGKAFQFVRRAIPRFLVGLFISVGLMASSELFGFGLRGVIAGAAVLGLIITLWPMVTPQTVEMLGMKRAFIVGRVLGVLMIISAVVFWFRI